LKTGRGPGRVSPTVATNSETARTRRGQYGRRTSESCFLPSSRCAVRCRQRRRVDQPMGGGWKLWWRLVGVCLLGVELATRYFGDSDDDANFDAVA
jgi:hypothetical protein